jgi:hypothetical protein
MIGKIISFALGALSGIVGTMVYVNRRDAKKYGATGHSKLAGRILPLSVGNPAPDALIPSAGYRSAADFEWQYVVGPGDTAGSIAEAITGDDGRYAELVLVNPHVEDIGTPGLYIGDAWDFKRLLEGEKLVLPLPWSRFIDELGAPRGATDPFPIDPRALPEPATPAALPAAHAAGMERARAAGRKNLPSGYDPFAEEAAA